MILDINWDSNLLQGLISSLAAAIIAFLGVWWTLRKRDEELRKKIRSAASSFLVLPEGTFFVENKVDEGVSISVIQKRLYEELSKNSNLVNKSDRDEIYRKIHKNDYEWFFEKILKYGNKKLSDVDLAAREKIEIPECEMFGYKAEDIKEVIIGTVLQYSPLRSEQNICEKLYIHRFTMGDSPEPRARWVAIYSKIRCPRKG